MVTVRKQEGDNAVHCRATCPIGNYDPDGEAAETALDVAAVGISAYEFVQDPSWSKAGWLALDVGAALVPFLPAVGIVRHAGKIDDVAKAIGKTDDAVDAAKAADAATDAGKAGKPAKGGTYKLIDQETEQVRRTAFRIWCSRNKINEDIKYIVK